MTARLVKARPKAVEYLPEWAICCPEQNEKYESLKCTVLTIDMGGTRIRKATCPDCGREHGKLVFTDVVAPYLGPIAIELVDLDEGPTA